MDLQHSKKAFQRTSCPNLWEHNNSDFRKFHEIGITCSTKLFIEGRKKLKNFLLVTLSRRKIIRLLRWFKKLLVHSHSGSKTRTNFETILGAQLALFETKPQLQLEVHLVIRSLYLFWKRHWWMRSSRMMTEQVEKYLGSVFDLAANRV